jgi:porin
MYFDMDKLLKIPDATFWIRAKGTWGGDASDFDKEKIGGLFKTNQDASSEEPLFVDKWHWQQFLLDKKLEIRLGRQEPVKDLFDTSKIIGHEDKYFMNRALVRNATIPSKKGLGLFVKWKFTDHAYLSVAALDAHARDRQTNFNTAFHDEDEFRFFGELGCKPKLESPKGKLWGHYRIGTWFDPTRKKRFFDTLDGLRAERYDSGDWGFFVGFDQMVWKEKDDPEDKQGIAIAGRYGYAHGEVNKIEHFWALAAQYEGLIPTRDEDVLGIGVGQGILADEYRRVHARADRETVYELYYSIKLAPWLTISPDLQYITNAGGDKDDPYAFVAGLRFKMSL